MTPLDECGGEHRNADLVLWGRLNDRSVLASIEAKADEPFDKLAGKYVDACALNQQSRVPERFALMCQGVLGCAPDSIDARGLRYQLLTGVVGTLRDAQEASSDIALFIVHEFVGATEEVKLAGNNDDLDRFLRIISGGTIASISAGQLLGPVSVPGNRYFGATNSLFIGKCRCHVRRDV